MVPGSWSELMLAPLLQVTHTQSCVKSALRVVGRVALRHGDRREYGTEAETVKVTTSHDLSKVGRRCLDTNSTFVSIARISCSEMTRMTAFSGMLLQFDRVAVVELMYQVCSSHPYIYPVHNN